LVALPIERLMVGIFVNQDHRQQARPKPRAIAWKGAGGCVIVSQERQLHFSRTCSVTHHWRGITSSVSVTSSPIFESLVPPQHGHEVDAG
jgi:hypothetical protein